MERADGNRKLWLLMSTSDRHRPECLAAAIALGILAGLVPKLNLLAVCLYGLILVLPVHTFLAVVVSVCVAFLSYQLDTAAHAIGQWLLSQSSLAPLWSSLERAPLVPWMSLHNTVVLGHLVIGTILLAPMYLISLRVFERMVYGGGARKATQTASIQSYAPVPVEETEPLTTKREPYRQREATPDRRRGEVSHPQESTVDRSPLIIPPPKLHRAAGQSTSETRLQAPDEPILFEPIDHARSGSMAPKSHIQPRNAEQDQPQSSINAWHMQHATGEAQFAAAGAPRKSLSQSAEVKVATTTPAQSSKLPSDVFYPQMTEAAAAGRDEQTTRPLPPAPERPEGVLSSLHLAQSASEVLAWVDDLLDECMAEEGMTLIAQDTEASTASIFERQTIDDAEMSSPSDRGNGPRWLMETTIEIVRLTDETMSDQSLMAEHSTNCQATDCQAQLDLSTPRSMENSSVMPTESMTRAWPRVGGMNSSSLATDHVLPLQDSGEPTILHLNQATVRASADGRTASDGRTGFQQLVMAGVSREPEQRQTLPIEPVKGECLAYLLGHLRQTREGKSS